jgi:sugar lactone lactonase YvrE
MSNVAITMGQAAAANSNFAGSWDLDYAYYDPDSAWDVTTLVGGVTSFSVATQETAPRSVFFKPDGTKMYIIGTTGDDVNEYNLSTAWDVSTASYVQVFSVGSQETTPSEVFFKPDGTKMYIIGLTGDDVNEYNLSTAWDVSTASYVQNFSVSAQETSPESLHFKPDGTKMYVCGVGNDTVNEYNLSTAWDVSTASYVQNFSVTTEEIAPTGLFFKPDGTKMFVCGSSGDDINEYSLSTAWDVSTASYTRVSSTLAESALHSMFFKPDGTTVYIVGTTNDRVYQYSLGAFDFSTQETDPTGIFIKPDGTKMYILGNAGNDVNEYNLSTAWATSTASYVQSFSVNTQEATPEDIFFKPDGTKMYVLGSNGDDINEYSLSTAWDISTASYVQVFSVASQETNPTGIFFKPDGTKMYICGSTGDDVNEYNLSTAWDISTASYSQNFDVSNEDFFPHSVSFKPDGTKMFIGGTNDDDVNEYNLSTAWDISTASYVQNFSIKLQEPDSRGLFFKDDGSKMYLIGNQNSTLGSVHTYTLLNNQ